MTAAPSPSRRRGVRLLIALVTLTSAFSFAVPPSAAFAASQHGETLAEDYRRVAASNATYSRDQRASIDAEQECSATDAKAYPEP